MTPRDTSADALHAQTAALMRLSGSERAEIAIDLAEATRELARAGLRARHPEYDETEVDLALFRLLYGDELFRQVWPGKSLLPA